MKNPYEVLNMPEDSDFEALKAQYEALKAQYGEERFLAGEQGAEGARKLTELEDAWSVIESKQKVKEDEAKYGAGFEAVEKFVLDHDYDGAQARLDAMTNRDAEWHYYQALVYYKREWMGDCRTHLNEAIRLDPDNKKYKDTLSRLTQKMANAQTPPEQLGGMNGGAQNNNYAAGNCLSNCCTTLCCLECMMAPFRCCGG